MKAQELRIGNLIQINIGNKKTDWIESSVDLNILYSFTCLENHGIKPIPLTEEWLLKFGMEYYDGFSNSRVLRVIKHKYDTSYITYSPNEKLLRFSNGQQKGSTIIPNIQYVHQLQNLYFALTGEELKLKS